MDTSNVPEFSENLAWSEPDEKNVVMAAGPVPGEFYIVQWTLNDISLTWAGLIVGERAFLRIVQDVTTGKTMCQNDLVSRRFSYYTNSFFCAPVN